MPKSPPPASLKSKGQEMTTKSQGALFKGQRLSSKLDTSGPLPLYLNLKDPHQKGAVNMEAYDINELPSPSSWLITHKAEVSEDRLKCDFASAWTW